MKATKLLTIYFLPPTLYDCLVLLGTINLGHVDHEVNDSVGVSPFVVVPGDKLDELGVQHDAGLGVENTRDGAGDEVGGDQVFGGVSEESLHVAVGASLDLVADLFVGGLFGKSAGQVDN